MTPSRSLVTLSYIIKAKFRRKPTPPSPSSSIFSSSLSSSHWTTNRNPFLPLQLLSRVQKQQHCISLIFFLLIFLSSSNFLFSAVHCSSPFLTPNNNNIAAKQTEQQEELGNVRRCNNGTQCYHGTCIGGDRCLCDFGWTGVNCAQCGGRIR